MLIIFLAALLGIVTRPLGLLSPFWPANALLAGLMVRNRRMATEQGWLGAFIALMAADLLTGTSLIRALVLTIANLLGAGVAYACLSRLPAKHVHLQRARSVMHLVLISVAASFCSSISGALALHQLFGMDFCDEFDVWLIGDLVNYVAILPVVLASSAPAQWPNRWPTHYQLARLPQGLAQAAPFMALVLSEGVAIWIGGPGAVMFSVPALLWCALTYSLFSVTLVTLIFSSSTMIAISAHHLDLSVPWPMGKVDLQSIRLGVLLMTLTPLTVAIVSITRQQLLIQVQYLAAHDQLSGLLNRRAFDQQTSEALPVLSRHNRLVAVLMLDIDHFKRINDTWGHAAGDQVLIAFARIAQECIPQNGVLGRMGGEEFAALFPVDTVEEARHIAETLRQRFEDTTVDYALQTRIKATVSVGVVTARGAEQAQPLMVQADRALYLAKGSGRNRVELQNMD
ncbi:diguanylate cyclase [Pseudomonas sp. CBMAI 2609]|uniref:diguanylate cyclase n=1 Tax=Pseudomonas flavocrustae TaxID=2991719 RepID=A0ABT6II19_9PSED|nr:diguanylate cyclase [Pseudomonas sp. CBMAI 2609]MDH4764118.1 diguanylate cyclase [Pseudomonas sp. CBMAI 2609]